MKTPGLMALFIALAARLLAVEPADAVPARRHVLQELTKEFRYEPKLAVDATSGLLEIVEPKVVRMDPVVVTAPGRARELESELRLRAQALKEKRFTLLNGGGTLLEHQGRRVTSAVQLKLSSVWHGAGFDFLSFSW